MRRLEALPDLLTLAARHIAGLAPHHHDLPELSRHDRIVIHRRQRFEPPTERSLDTEVRPLLPLGQVAQLAHAAPQSALRLTQSRRERVAIPGARQPPQVAQNRPRRSLPALGVVECEVLVPQGLLDLIASSLLPSEVLLLATTALLASRRQPLGPSCLGRLDAGPELGHVVGRGDRHQLGPLPVRAGPGRLQTGRRGLTDRLECAGQLSEPRDAVGGQALLPHLSLGARCQRLEAAFDSRHLVCGRRVTGARQIRQRLPRIAYPR